MDISVITPLPSGEGTGEGPLTYRGISVITPRPLEEETGEGPVGDGGGVYTFLLCSSVRSRRFSVSY